ncbi:MAG: hypothetical protein A2017_09155 [Lentisphaerae bacterium GWF2_44_16]|nr:MAG: hypothetical protein A2017_09155 [Lentisphaerae bacterium GWF2_44_16]
MQENKAESLCGVKNYLRKEFELDDNDVEEMIDEYFKNMDSLIEKGGEQSRGAAWGELARTGHSIKGASANIGANIMSETGKALELGAREEKKDECEQALKKLRADFDNLREQRVNE